MLIQSFCALNIMIVMRLMREEKRRLINNFLPLSNFIYMADAVLQKAKASPIYFGELAKMLKEFIFAEIQALEIVFCYIFSVHFITA